MFSKFLRRLFTKENKSFLLRGMIGGLIFLGAFYLQYAGIDAGKYQDRDDAVITLSHAKNWVDHGHIGVNPSGERVEAYSSPFQFWAYTIAYAVTGIGWWRYFQLQTLFCTFLLGFIVAQFFSEKKILGWILVVFSALLMSQFHRFLEWHGSGMENAWMHVWLAATLWILYKSFRVSKINYWWAIPIFFASITRTESIVHILPLLVLFSAFWMQYKANWQGVIFSGLVFGLWLVFQGWRLMYFGSFVPNSGLAQGISVSHNIGNLFAGDESVRVLVDHSLELFRNHGGWLLFGGIFLLPFVRFKNESQFLLLACGLLAITAFAHPMVFGRTRLDISRATTFLAVSSVLGFAIIVLRMRWKRVFLEGGILAALLVIGFLIGRNMVDRNVKFCCACDPYQEFVAIGKEFEEQNQLHRLTVANPDLGKFSFDKNFNLVDLGFLGSPILTKMMDDSDMMREYLFGFALPDMIEVHGEWCLKYSRFLADGRFREIYEPIKETRAGYLSENGKEWPTVTEGVFVRKGLKKGSNSKEYKLIQDLNGDLSLDRIKTELESSLIAGDPTAHQYVVRSAYRFLPEFRDQDLEEELVQLFAETPSAAYDQAILESAEENDWADRALQFLMPLLEQQTRGALQDSVGSTVELLKDGRRRYWMTAEGDLVIGIYSPRPGELQDEFLVHAFPADREKALKMNKWGAIFNEFFWDECEEWVIGSEHFYLVDLPADTPMQTISVGQRRGEGPRLWEEKIRF